MPPPLHDALPTPDAVFRPWLPAQRARHGRSQCARTRHCYRHRHGERQQQRNTTPAVSASASPGNGAPPAAAHAEEGSALLLVALLARRRRKTAWSRDAGADQPPD